MVFGNIRHIRPPPISKAATMKVGAGHMVSSKVAITTLPMIPPRRAATMEIATPVALKREKPIILHSTQRTTMELTSNGLGKPQ